jgi:two-component system, OmpR family, sensor histidine kinase KdpD
MGETRGHYKIFLGMAAGVGKTYRMLQEARAAAEAGRDVVIGYLEPHERAETIALAEGLEVVPRSRVPYRETVTSEMDLPAVLGRAPELCLIDELAHTNPPGLEHAKRYEDIEDVLAAGIDVFSTVNIQHLESLNDQVADVTGVRVRETFPDTVLSSADEVVLIDLTPQALIQRLREGKVYPAERVDAALNNFFRVENLNALRELVLREMAEDVEAKRIVTEPLGTRDDDRVAGAAPQAVGERLLALVSARPSSQRLARRAWRSAQRLGAELDLLYVKKPGARVNGRQQEQLEALRKLAATLGAHLLIEEGHDVAETAARVGAQRGTTYVLLGQPRSASGLRRFGVSLPEKLIEHMPGVDIRIVADRTKKRQ